MPTTDEIKRRKGDRAAILDGLVSKSPVFRFQAICGAVNHNLHEQEVVARIEALVDDNAEIMGYPISALAVAALAKLGKAVYQGKDRTIKQLIDAPLWFDDGEKA